MAKLLNTNVERSSAMTTKQNYGHREFGIESFDLFDDGSLPLGNWWILPSVLGGLTVWIMLISWLSSLWV